MFFLLMLLFSCSVLVMFLFVLILGVVLRVFVIRGFRIVWVLRFRLLVKFVMVVMWVLVVLLKFMVRMCDRCFMCVFRLGFVLFVRVVVKGVRFFVLGLWLMLIKVVLCMVGFVLVK